MPTPSSEQEALCHEFLRRSVGAAWCFIPDKYRRGSNEKEAADLVWQGIGCVVLFYMRGSGTDTVENIDRHNFGQARGWLRQWRRGVLLKGTNRLQEFEIPFNEVRHVVVVSVVRCSDERAAYQHEYARDLRVTMAATLTETDVSEMAQCGWTTIDLIYHLNCLRLDQLNWSQGFVSRAAKVVSERVVSSISTSSVPHPKCIGSAFSLLTDLRMFSENIVRIESRLPGQLIMAHMLGDLTLGENLGIGFSIATCLFRARRRPVGRGEGYAEMVVRLPRGIFRIWAFTPEHAGQGLLHRDVAEQMPAESAYELSASLAITDANPPAIHPLYTFTRGDGLSNAETLLDQVAEDEGASLGPLARKGQAVIHVGPRIADIGTPGHEGASSKMPRPRRRNR